MTVSWDNLSCFNIGIHESPDIVIIPLLAILVGEVHEESEAFLVC
jgi:hypothetical protein